MFSRILYRISPRLVILVKIHSGGLSVTAHPIPKQLLKGMAVARTTDACTLTVMEEVMKSYLTLYVYLEKVIDYAGNETYVPDIPVDHTDHYMKEAIAYYRAGSGQCQTVISKTKWEVCLEHISHAPYLFQKAQTEFYLLAGGLSAQWVKQSKDVLYEQKGFVQAKVANQTIGQICISIGKPIETHTEKYVNSQFKY